MDRKALTDTMIAAEWQMFHNVNGEARTDCQEDPTTFDAMRRAQYDAWDEAVLESYAADLEAAAAAGRNLAREKYIHMMRSTDPSGYAHFAGELPALSDEARALAEEITAINVAQSAALHQQYPFVALGGRPLTTAEDNAQATSIETYQRSELYTYSENTLRLLAAQIKRMEAEGVALARCILENTVRCYGYADLAVAEEAVKAQAMRYLDSLSGNCNACRPTEFPV